MYSGKYVFAQILQFINEYEFDMCVKWLRSQNIIVRINDYLFMHAGILPRFAVYAFTYSDINSTIQKYINSGYRLERGSPESMILGHNEQLAINTSC